jgi:multidrug resistance protein
MVFAPLSEMVGRRPVYGVTLLVALVFTILCAVSDNIGTLIVCPAIDGFALSALMILVGGTLADLWRDAERGVPMAAFSAAPFLGPAIGPLAGGFLGDHAGWRWLYWLQLILAFVAWLLIMFTVSETYTPVPLKRRAKSLRKAENDGPYTTQVGSDSRPLEKKLQIFLSCPFRLLFPEPMIFFMSIYMSVFYGLLYMFFCCAR